MIETAQFVGFFLAGLLVGGWGVSLIIFRKALKASGIDEYRWFDWGAPFWVCDALQEARRQLEIRKKQIERLKESDRRRMDEVLQARGDYAEAVRRVREYVLEGNADQRLSLACLISEDRPGLRLLEEIGTLRGKVMELEESTAGAWERAKVMQGLKETWRQRALEAERTLQMKAVGK